MPYSVRLFLITSVDPLSAEEVQAPWWTHDAVSRLPGLREMYSNSPYVDYIVGISPEEAKRMDQEFWLASSYSAHPNEAHKRLTELFETKDRVQWVLVKLYEWESGLGD